MESKHTVVIGIIPRNFNYFLYLQRAAYNTSFLHKTVLFGIVADKRMEEWKTFFKIEMCIIIHCEIKENEVN